VEIPIAKEKSNLDIEQQEPASAKPNDGCNPEWNLAFIGGRRRERSSALSSTILMQRGQRAQAFGTPVEEEPNTDNGTGMRTFVIQDLDGYHVAVNEARR